MQQPHQRQQRHLCIQHAALYLGKAVELLLPPDATESLDALEQEPVPQLLAALAALCRISPDSLQQYLQVQPQLVVSSCCHANKGKIIVAIYLSLRNEILRLQLTGSAQ